MLEQDPTATGLLCLEEPENGIHPERMDAMMRLLGDMAVDTDESVDDENPLRQIIVSTHSPVVAARARADELVFADHRDAPGQRPGAMRSLVVRPVKDAWRAVDDVAPVAHGDVIQYLGALRPEPSPSESTGKSAVYDVVTRQLSLFPGTER